MSGPPSMFDAPHSATTAAQPEHYVQPNLGHGLRIWWAFYWRTALSSIVLATALNVMLRRFSDKPTVVLIAQYDLYLFYYLVAFLVMAYILRKRFRHFRIVLLSNGGEEGSTPLTPSLHRTGRIWWTFTWRSVIYRVIVAFAVSFPLGWTMGFLMALLPGRATPVLINLGVQIFLDAIIGMFVIYSNILDEDIFDFRVTLSPRSTSESSLATAAAPQS